MPKWSRNQMFFTFSTFFMLMVALYICIRLIMPLEVSLWFKVPLLIAVILASQTMSFMRYIVVKAPHFPFWIMRVGGFICAVFMVLISVVALRDILLFGLLLLHSVLGTWLPGLATFAAFLNSPLIAESLLLFSALISALGMWRALQVPRVHTVELQHPDLPEYWNKTRIIQLSDLHIGSTFTGAWLRKVVARTNSLKPDFILITGDLVDGEPYHMASAMAALTDLQASQAVLISVGNHEYYSGLEPWVESWRSMGLTVLLNEHRVFPAPESNTPDTPNHPLIVAGIADPTALHFPGMLPPDPVAALAHAPDGFRILMAHQPKHAAKHAALGFHVQLSGHTHGGQYVPLFPIVSLLNRGFRTGLYHVHSMLLYVSPGTGLWGYVPMRIGASSEITEIVLTK